MKFFIFKERWGRLIIVLRENLVKFEKSFGYPLLHIIKKKKCVHVTKKVFLIKNNNEFQKIKFFVEMNFLI